MGRTSLIVSDDSGRVRAGALLRRSTRHRRCCRSRALLAAHDQHWDEREAVDGSIRKDPTSASTMNKLTLYGTHSVQGQNVSLRCGGFNGGAWRNEAVWSARDGFWLHRRHLGPSRLLLRGASRRRGLDVSPRSVRLPAKTFARRRVGSVQPSWRKTAQQVRLNSAANYQRYVRQDRVVVPRSATESEARLVDFHDTCLTQSAYAEHFAWLMACAAPLHAVSPA